MTVDYATADGAAAQPADYTAASGTLTFTPGQTSKTISVAVKGDTLDENDEGYVVGLSNPSNATLADATGAGTITDDDPLVSASIGDASVTEGNSGTVNAVFTVVAQRGQRQDDRGRLRDRRRRRDPAGRLHADQRAR